MKPLNPIPLMTAILLCTISSIAQKDTSQSLLLKTNAFVPSRNISVAVIEDFNSRSFRLDGQAFTIIQFEAIPTAEQRKELQVAGIELLEYIPNNAYSVSVMGKLELAILQRTGARALVQLEPQHKIHPSLQKQNIPDWSVKVQGTVDVWISFPKTASSASVIRELAAKNFDILTLAWVKYNVISLRISASRLNELASLAYIEFVQPAPREDQPLNNVAQANSKGNILKAPTAIGGRNLSGEGIVIGVGDNADPQTHADFTGRLINHAATAYNYHGTHVAGIVGGAGIRTELYAGYAPKSTVISQLYSGIFLNAASYVTDHGMVISNNSYGAIVGDCSYNGLYDLYSRILDLQAFELPELQHVFAAGNSGYSGCAPYPTGFKTVLGSYQSAKNVLTVGNTYPDGSLFPNSSRGPVQDGRTKPEIVAQGTWVWSTANSVPYFHNTGTSMAAPVVSGGLGLLYERFRQLNAGANPKSGLMKALLVNGGNDLGNAGPDYSNGFGWMNLLRSVEMLENNRYVISTINNGINNTHNITVPANTAQLKVMLYWHDPAASVLAGHTLVNDLDLEVQDPSLSISLPGKLDTIPANITNPATTGADHINNIEQVVINGPASGGFTVTVKGTAVTQAPPQEYFLVYDIIPVSTRLTFPVGSEKLMAGEIVNISWDSYGDPANTFTVQYSIDNGANWTDINTNVASNLRLLSWTVPSAVTDEALVRITRNGTGMTSTSLPFTILGLPVVSLAPVQCEGYISINWTAVTGATDYELMWLRGIEMVPLATTAATTFTLNGLSKDSVYWVSVRARLNGNAGRRGDAVSRQPNNGTCAGTISDNDLKVDALVAPVSGRSFTSTTLGPAVTISARVKNLDDAAINSYDLKYSINGGAWVTENVNTPLAGGTTNTYNFTTTADLSAVGIYTIRIVAKNLVSDPVSANDTLIVVVKHLDNQPINLGTTFIDNFDATPVQSHNTQQTGLTGLDRYDFSNSTIYGRVRSFLSTGIAYSGNRALTLDAYRYHAPGNTNLLSGTYSLATYNAAVNDVRLDFRFKNHGQVPNANNMVWVRGDDSQPWLLAYDLDENHNDYDVGYKLSSSIELGDLLAANGQNFTTSFQVRWGQWGQLLAGDFQNGHGYTFDDVRLYEVFDDIQMLSIDTPIVASCGLSAAVPVRVTVRNSANTTINNIPVNFRINDGTTITETIPSILGNATVVYTFTATANLSAISTHKVEVWVDLLTDSYAENDSLVSFITNSPVITSFPHIENFETSNGSWYTAGKKTSWEYGTPVSAKIRSAATGSKAWKTRLSGNYNDLEHSYLYSPCYDITGMTNPTLSFSVALDIEDCGAGGLCDGAYIEYSEDGVNWSRLGGVGSGTNWYNRNYGGNQLWSIENYTRWHVATHALPTGINRLRLRFVVVSDPYVNKEGIAIDDIHIYDNTMGIYDGVTMAAPVTQNISGGSSWVDFTSGGKLIASIQPNNQNLGNTDVQTYIHQSPPVRDYNGQYYHNRNLTIKPTQVNLADSVTVRFYFLDSETDSLVFATGCATCTKPAHAYELGVSKYADTDDNIENGSVVDNVSGNWSFINSANATKVPFDKGYYVEFKVKSFSEFWLNDGGFDNNHSLPVDLLAFSAKKMLNNDVSVEWETAAEFNVNRFEIELAKGNQQYQSNSFLKIGEMNSQGASAGVQQYNFTDAELGKSGVRYYRLKIVDHDGYFSYSAIRPVVFSAESSWVVYPNPSKGLFNLVFQLNVGETMGVKVFDINGRLILNNTFNGDGFMQKQPIDLGQAKYPAGMYLLQAESGGEKKVFRLIKE